MLKPQVSIIIPAYNEGRVIGKLLTSIANQTYKYVETIVIDDNSTDDTADVSLVYTKNVFRKSHAERSVQRNFGASVAKGEYLLFLDADMKLSPNLVIDCVICIQSDKKIGAIAIPEQSVSHTFWEKVKAFERSFYSKEGDLDTDAARFFPKNIFDQVGGYDTTLTGPEDWDLPEMIKDQGYKVGRVKSIIYHYERVNSVIKLAKKKYYYALTAHRYLKKHNISAVGSKTVYFLRPVFYRQWKKLIANPVYTIAMAYMFTLETLFGAIGFIVGTFKYP